MLVLPTPGECDLVHDSLSISAAGQQAGAATALCHERCIPGSSLLLTAGADQATRKGRMVLSNLMWTFIALNLHH